MHGWTDYNYRAPFGAGANGRETDAQGRRRRWEGDGSGGRDPPLLNKAGSDTPFFRHKSIDYFSFQFAPPPHTHT